MAESFKTRLWRWTINLWPCYRGTGARLTYIASDWREVRIKLPLSLRTRNYVGTIYGGSMYGAIDPIYMLMLIKTLGPGYVVWDKAAAIRFKRPGRSTLHARCAVDDREIETIKELLTRQSSIDRVYEITLRDDKEKIHAVIEKTLYIRRRQDGASDNAD
ncbi:MAG: DUF4442 domain-containing protein [Phycisphaerae bacterium]|nr:DUF4442 domain-containing protein [Phycisphaerae bacterium]